MAQPVDPRVTQAEQRADDALSLFNELEKQRKAVASGNPISQIKPRVSFSPSSPVAELANRVATEAKGGQPSGIPAVTQNQSLLSAQAEAAKLVGEITPQSSLEEMKAAVDKGNFSPAQYLAGLDDQPGGRFAYITPEELEKLRDAYRYQRSLGFSPLRAGKSAIKGAGEIIGGLAKAAIDLPGHAVNLARDVKDLATAEIKGDDTGAGSAKDRLLKEALEVESGAEVGFGSTIDMARRGIRKHVVDRFRDSVEIAKQGQVKEAVKLALEGIPGVSMIVGGHKTDTTSPEAIARFDKELEDDVAWLKQTAESARGEGPYFKAATSSGGILTPTGDGISAKELAESKGTPLNPERISQHSLWANPFMVAGPLSKLVKDFGLFGRTKPVGPVPEITPTLATIKPRPVAGGAMKTVGKAASVAGSHPLSAGKAIVGSIGGPKGIAGVLVGSEVLRRLGTWLSKRGDALAKGEAVAPAAGTGLFNAVKDVVMTPVKGGVEGAVGVALHPTTLGLALFTENDQDFGSVLGSAAGFGGAFGAGHATVTGAARGTHGLLARDLTSQGKLALREEAFDPNWGDHAELTRQNLDRLNETDRTIVNVLRNNIRQINVAEPDLAGDLTPQNKSATEWITGGGTDGNGTVYYETNAGRKVGAVEAGDIAWGAGQPLKDVSYKAEVVLGSPDSLRMDPDLAASLGQNARGNRGVANITRTGPEGKATIYLNKDAFSAYHEATHVYDFASHPSERARLRQTAIDTYGATRIEALRRYYGHVLSARDIAHQTELLNAPGLSPQQQALVKANIAALKRSQGWMPQANIRPKNPGADHIVAHSSEGKWVVDNGQGERRIVDPQEAQQIAGAQGQVLVTTETALTEAVAAMGDLALRTRSLQGIPENMRQIAARSLMRFIETSGLHKPGIGTVTPENQASLGFEYSALADDAFWTSVKRAAGPQAEGGSVIAPTGPEFFGNQGQGGTAQQRIGTTFSPDESPIERPPVPPEPQRTPESSPGKGVKVENDRTVIDTGLVSDTEVSQVLKGLRELGVPEAEVARVEEVLRAKGGTVELTYASGTPELLPPSELARERRAERRATYEAEQGAVNEELRAIAPETRTKFTRRFVPHRVIVRPAKNGQVQVNILGLSPSKVLQNAIILDQQVRAINAKLPPEQRMALPFQEGADRATRYNYDQLFDALEKYTENQNNGYTGTGEKLERPEGFIENLPVENPNFVPHKLSETKAAFVNLLMGVEPPLTTKSMKRTGVKTEEGIRAVPLGETPAKGLEKVEIQPAHVSAFQLSEANAPGRGVPSPTRDTGITGPRSAPPKPWEVGVPTRAMRKGAPATQVKKGTFKDPVSGAEFDIQEFNRFRAEITDKARKAGDANFDLQDKLAEAFEELNTELLEDIKPVGAEEGPQLKYPSQTMVEAGFLPEELSKHRMELLEKNAYQSGTHRWAIKKRNGEQVGTVLRDNKPYAKYRLIRPDRAFEEFSSKQKLLDYLDQNVTGEARALPEQLSPEFAAKQAAKRRMLEENLGVGVGRPRRDQVKSYPAKSEMGQRIEQDGFTLNKWESDGGFGIVSIKAPGGEHVGDVMYQARVLDNGAIDYHIQMIEVKPEFRKPRITKSGRTHYAETLYRELAEIAKTQGSLSISGDPINERAMALRQKVFEDTNVMDPIDSTTKIVDSADLQTAIEDAGGLVPFMAEQGMFELTSFFRENQRFLPEEAEVPVLAAVRHIESGDVYTGPMHLFAYMKASEGKPASVTESPDFYTKFTDGFETNKGRFVSREEAAQLAEKNLGVKAGSRLNSEDLPAQGEAIRRTNAQLKPDASLKENRDAMEQNLFDVIAEQRALPENLADRDTSGQAFTGFFSRVTKGEFGKSDVPFKPILDVSKNQGFIDTYANHRGNFDEHIAKSIPTYMEIQVKKGDALSRILPEGSRVLDIGASEGSLMKAISESSAGKIETVSLDPNPDMAKFFREKSNVPGARFVEEAFHKGFEEEGKTVPAFNPDKKFDVINESMTLQFISNDRVAHIAEMKRLLNEDGMVLIEEKVKADSPEQWAANESLKDREWKDKYFSKEELAAKDKGVGFQQSKQETKAVGMVDNMVSAPDLEGVLADEFQHVVQYWDSGNFKGYAASDNPAKLQEFTEALGDVNSKFNTADVPREVKALPADKDLELKHYSNVPGLKVLDPAKHGTGLLGAERSRKKAYPELYVDRTYYGMKGYKKEQGLGPHTYEAVVKDSKVYDYLKDPEDLFPGMSELKDAGYAPLDNTAAVTMYERRIRDEGFDGFKNTQAKVAALFKKQKVTQVKDTRALPEATAPLSEGGKELEAKGFKLEVDPNYYGRGQHRGWVFRATKEGESAGNLHVRVEDGKARVQWLYTEPEFRGQGIASSLYKEAGKRLQDAGITELGGTPLDEYVTGLREKVFGKGTKREAEVTTPVNPEAKFLPGDKNLFGQHEYNAKAISQMNERELKAHFPEAIVPRRAINDRGELKKKLIDYDIESAPLIKKAETREEAVRLFADKLKDFYKTVEGMPEAEAGKKWYSEFTPELKKAFGDDAQIFAELLAASSPNTNPEQNFAYAADSYFNWKGGNYDRHVKTFLEGFDQLETGQWEATYNEAIQKGAKRTGSGDPTQAEFMAWWIDSHNLQPRGSGGKLLGFHSTRVLQVLARKWLETNKGPKTSTFVSNLLGTGHEATIDVWAARTMRRLGYEGLKDRWRILPENSTGVTDADFYLSQEAFKLAAKELGMRPSSLQGALWFAEKKHWADNGWGRLDLGDFRSELKKLGLLKSRFTEAEKVKSREKKTQKGSQEELF